MKKVVLLFILSLGVMSFTSQTVSTAHEEGPQPSIAQSFDSAGSGHLLAVDAGPGPTLIANHI